MFGVELTCSDQDCAHTIEAVGPDLTRLEALVCEGCECTLVVTAVWEVEVVRIDPPDELPLAA